MTKVGTRVFVIIGESDDRKKIVTMGEGVHEGDHDVGPEVPGPMAEALREGGVKNPRILLDSGERVWGCEVWFGEAERVKELLAARVEKGAEVETQDVAFLRSTDRRNAGDLDAIRKAAYETAITANLSKGGASIVASIRRTMAAAEAMRDAANQIAEGKIEGVSNMLDSATSLIEACSEVVPFASWALGQLPGNATENDPDLELDGFEWFAATVNDGLPYDENGPIAVKHAELKAAVDAWEKAKASK